VKSCDRYGGVVFMGANNANNKEAKYAELQKYIDILSAFPEIERIYLFGSYIYGEPTEHSDIDIAVILADNANANKSAYKIEKALASRKTPLDLFIDKASRFRDYSSNISTLQNDILTKGVLMYDK
jgi:predicted nucleotidyltransferase